MPACLLALTSTLKLATVSLLMTAGCAKQPAAQPAEPASLATIPRASLKAIDAEGNPYRDQYADMDRWLYDHLQTDANGDYVCQRPQPPQKTIRMGGGMSLDVDDPAVKVFPTELNNDGFVIPALVQGRARQKAVAEGRLEQFLRDERQVWAMGPMDPDLLRDFSRSYYEITIADDPVAPKWLADNPPQFALILSSGHVVTIGRLGSASIEAATHNPKQPVLYSESNPLFFHYDPGGNLVAATADSWWSMFHDLDEIHRAGQTISITDYGVVELRKGDEVVSRWTYEGKEIKSGDPLPNPDRHLYRFLPGEAIKAEYHARIGDWDYVENRTGDK